MLYIGLTGNIASGKSEVAQIFAGYGATVIDADMLAREAVAPGTTGMRRIMDRWGPGVVMPNGTLDRAALRHTVFSDRDELDALNAIVHPEVSALRNVLFSEAQARGDPVLVYAVPLLFEQGLIDEFDKVVLVDAPLPVRLDRIIKIRGIEPNEALNMIAAQMPSEFKRSQADILIENTGSLDNLRRQVATAWEQLTASKGHSSLAL